MKSLSGNVMVLLGLCIVLEVGFGTLYAGNGAYTGRYGARRRSYPFIAGSPETYGYRNYTPETRYYYRWSARNIGIGYENQKICRPHRGLLDTCVIFPCMSSSS